MEGETRKPTLDVRRNEFMKRKSRPKRRIISLLLAAVLCVGLIPFSAASRSTAAAAETLNYLALGDSITSGYGLTDPDTEGFVTLLAAEIGADSADNEGVEGMTTESLAETLASLEMGSEKYAAIQSADLITITIGGNDMMMSFYGFIAGKYNEAYSPATDLEAADVKAIFSSPAAYATEFQYLLNLLIYNDYSGELETSADFQNEVAAYVANIYAIADTIHNINSDAVIVVANQYNPYQWLPEAYQNIVGLFDAGVSYYNTELPGSGYTVADVYSAFAASADTALTNVDVSALIPSLDFHPNAAGHEVIADVMELAYDLEAGIYTYEIPIELTVTNGGSAEAPAQDFEAEALDWSYEVIDFGEIGGKIITDSVETDGKGTYTATLKIKGDSETELMLSDGFFLQLSDGGADGWTYDDTEYYVIVFFDDGVPYETDIYEVINGDWDSSKNLSAASFECTWTGWTLAFDTGGGSEVSSVSYVAGKVINLADYTTTRSGYDFDGWYAESTLQNEITSVTLNADTTVYAGWTESAAEPTVYTITASAGDNGTISPASAEVEEGDDAAFTIEPASGYQISTVLLDGTDDVTADVSDDNTYTIENVQSSHTIYVTFEAIDVPPYYLAAGDSISTGSGLDDAAAECFVALFADGIDADTTVNEAIDDLTAADLALMLKYVDETSRYYVEAEAADVVTITIGCNDLMDALYAFAAEIYNDKYGTSLGADEIEAIIMEPGSSVATLIQAQQLFSILNGTDYSADLEASDDFKDAVEACVADINSIAATIKTINPDAVILAANQYNPYQWLSNCDNISSLFDTGAAYFNEALAAGRTSDYTIADVYTAFAESGDTLTNAAVNFSSASFDFDFLPNAAGHVVIAETMLNAYAAATSEYSWDIPVRIKTVEDGSAETPALTFDLEILDLDTGEVIDIASDEIGGTVVSNTVSTRDAGEYSAVLSFTGGYDLYELLCDGFYVRLSDGGADGWVYDDTEYYVNVYFDGGEAYETVIYEAEDYQNSDEPEPLTEAAFTCSYTGWILSFVSNDGSAVDSVSAADGTTIALSDYVSARVGYTFTGWYAESTLETPAEEVTLTGDTVLYAGWEANRIDVPTDTVDDYLAVGDSIVTGYGLDDPETESYVPLFAGAINAQATVNRGALNLTSAQLLEDMEAGEYDEDIAEADVITVTVGANDMMNAFCTSIADIYNENNTTGSYLTADGVKSILTFGSGEIETYSLIQTLSDSGSGDFGDAYDLFVLLNTNDYSDTLTGSDTFTSAVDDCAANINSITAKIRESNPDAVILVTNQYNPYSWLTGCDNIVKLFDTGYAAYNDALEAAATSDYTLADISSAFASYSVSLTNADSDIYTLYLYFDFHPNAAGHQVIADVLLNSYASAASAATDYTLSFETNGGSEIDSVTAAEGTTISLADYTTTRSGYTFKGWYADSALETLITEVTLTGDTTVYAGWAEASGTGDGDSGTDTDSDSGDSDTGTDTDSGTDADTGSSGTDTSDSDTSSTDTGSASQSTASASVQTGDSGYAGLWIAVCILGGLLTGSTVVLNKRRTRQGFDRS